MKYLNARISDKINEYYKTGEVVTSSFMNPGEIIEIMGTLKNVPYVLNGGYEEAERKVAFIGADEDDVDLRNFLCIIRITPNANVNLSEDDAKVKLSHRSILGSILGLGVKREMVGDIVIGEKSCDVIVIKSIAEFLLNNLKSVGREKVKTEEVEISDLQKIIENEKEISASVSSLRVDSIISAGYGISREKSSALVKGELVKINHVVIKSPTKMVSEGDIISVRGKGRLVLKEVSGRTRSDRIRVVLIRK